VFELSASQTWTDTGIDLKTGDTVKISASPMPVSGGQACDPKGEGAPLLVGAGSDLHITEVSHLFWGINASGTPPCLGQSRSGFLRTDRGCDR
jgi:hypothetical protein